jgi:hypothetical protein
MSPQQKEAAASLGISEESYARSHYAIELERGILTGKAEKAGHLVERLAQRNAPGLKVESVWLKTLDGKFRFDAEWNNASFLIFLNEDVLDDLLESGSKSAEEQISRAIEYSLPSAKAARAS